mgnify:CR=1 FL=1
MVHSKAVSEREAFGKRLQEVLRDLSERYAGSVYAPLVQSKGIDELSGIIQRGEVIPSILFDLAIALYPSEFRFGVARGEVAPLSKVATEADGEAFHRAARALELAEKERRYFKMDGVASRGAEIVQLLVHQSLSRIFSWPAATARAAREKWEHPELKNDELAARFEVSPQAISKKLRRSCLDELRESRRVLGGWFGTLSSSPSV